MSRCSIENLVDVKETVLAEIRKWPQIEEPKPGVFYFKRIPFLHFHEKDSKRWADIKLDGSFEPVDLPFDPSKTEVAVFLKIARQRYEAMLKN